MHYFFYIKNPSRHDSFPETIHPHLYLKKTHLLTFTFKSTLKFLQHSKARLPQKEVSFPPVPVQLFVGSRDKLHEKMVQVKINIVGDGWVLWCWLVWFFFLLSFNPDLSTLPFQCAAKQNACKEGTEQRLGQAHESPTYFGGSSGFAYKGCVCQSLRKSVSMHFGLMGLFVMYLTIKYTTINLTHND